MSYGQSRKSTPMELLRASNSGVGPAPKRPPHSLCDVFAAGRADEGAGAGASAIFLFVVLNALGQTPASSPTGSSAVAAGESGAAVADAVLAAASS
jgi:hypothetical protein